MMTSNTKIYLTLLILVAAMACAFVQDLLVPPTSTSTIPTSSSTPWPPTPSPTVLAPTATAVFEAACPELLTGIMKTATDTSARFAEDEVLPRFLVTYTIKEDKLWQRQDIFVPVELKSEWDSRAAHEFIWSYFSALIPEEERSYVAEFSIMSDGHESVLGSVRPSYDDLSKWNLSIDILDAKDSYLLTFTLMHEFGHLRTLNSKQVLLDPLVLQNPDDEDIRKRAIAACPRYFTGMAAVNPGPT